MFGRKPNATPDIESLLSASTRIQGDVLFSGGLHLDGAVAGSVKSTGEGVAVLVIGESAVIEGSVVAPIVELYGVVRGDIVAPGRVVLGPKGRVEGNVQYGALEVAAGASIKGRLIKLAAAHPVAAQLESTGGSK